MARVIVSVPDSAWVDLGTGQMVMTIHKEGTGSLLINNSQDVPTALRVTKGRAGDQFFNNNPDATISAYADGGAGWEIAVDAE